MRYKTTQVFVVVRHDGVFNEHTPVGVYRDLETAEGECDHLNIEWTQRFDSKVVFYVKPSILYEQ